jgi:hypothetical protein
MDVSFELISTKEKGENSGMAQVGESPQSKHDALGSNPSTPQNKTNEQKTTIKQSQKTKEGWGATQEFTCL